MCEELTHCLGGLLEVSHTVLKQKSFFFAFRSAFACKKCCVNLALAHPVSSNGQWVSRVHVPLSIISRLPVSKDLHLEVSHHGVHHLSTHKMNKKLLSKTVIKPIIVIILCPMAYCFWSQISPIDSPWPFLWLDFNVIVVDVDLGDLHLEVIGQQANRLPHRAQAGPAWWLEKGGRGRRAYRKHTQMTDL